VIREAEIELADSKRIATCLSDGFAVVDEELRELRKAPLENMHRALEEEVISLRRQVQDAEEANVELVRRAQTIHAAHKAGSGKFY
jgi:hypothetical protein